MSVKASRPRERVSTTSCAERAPRLSVGVFSRISYPGTSSGRSKLPTRIPASSSAASRCSSSKTPGAGRTSGIASALTGSSPARHRKTATTATKTRAAAPSRVILLMDDPRWVAGAATGCSAGEEAGRVPDQEEAPARRVVGDADQLPAVPGVLVDRLLQRNQRRALPTVRQRDVLGVVALGLRRVVGVSLSL